ncbi:hypothetical protein M0654_22645, partial [Rhizobium sp. NTR19]|nr:hypothetical protein [Neorhizobium turbinariae]
MSNILWKSLVVSPAVLGATLLVSATAIAAPNKTTVVSPAAQPGVTEVAQQPEILAQTTIDQVNRYSNEGTQNNS